MSLGPCGPESHAVLWLLNQIWALTVALLFLRCKLWPWRRETTPVLTVCPKLGSWSPRDEVKAINTPQCCCVGDPCAPEQRASLFTRGGFARTRSWCRERLSSRSGIYVESNVAVWASELACVDLKPRTWKMKTHWHDKTGQICVTDTFENFIWSFGASCVTGLRLFFQFVPILTDVHVVLPGQSDQTNQAEPPVSS